MYPTSINPMTLDQNICILALGIYHSIIVPFVQWGHQSLAKIRFSRNRQYVPSNKQGGACDTAPRVSQWCHGFWFKRFSRSMCSARSVADSSSLITLNNFQIIVSDVSREFSGAIRLSHIIKFESQMYNFGASRWAHMRWAPASRMPSPTVVACFAFLISALIYMWVISL